ncbi:hypothetical protein Cci01nite_52080 [Catellatospora citrea]|uniref:Uncharacterized protein n=1 Tax=Catellatospora citrea TaxID=53366 RepID=A0A8J3KQE0_9ACTN|nr:hypothetical protein C8E86_0240 [Catellatospora citrea]GIG00115.1 hypothetical protein Cci01nite_52080 [Catellatospora citrea]
MSETGKPVPVRVRSFTYLAESRPVVPEAPGTADQAGTTRHESPSPTIPAVASDHDLYPA